VARPKVIVAVRDAESVESLVTLACQVSSGMDAELTALHVIEVPMATPLEADDEVLEHPGREIVSHAQRFAAERHGRSISARLLRARQAGEAIVGELKDQGCELLIMGYTDLTPWLPSCWVPPSNMLAATLPAASSFRFLRRTVIEATGLRPALDRAVRSRMSTPLEPVLCCL